MRMILEEMRLQDVSYNRAPGPWHYPAPAGSTVSMKDVVYADPRWVRGMTARYMVESEEMLDKKGHCPMMVTVEVKGWEPGEDRDQEQESDEEGFDLPTPPGWPREEEYDKWQQWVQQVHVEMRRRSHAHPAMIKAVNMCGFSRPVEERKNQAQAATAGGKAEVDTAGGCEGPSQRVPTRRRRLRKQKNGCKRHGRQWRASMAESRKK